MALIGICSSPSLECVDIPCSSFRLINFSTKLKIMPRINRIGCHFYSKRSTIGCSLSKEAISSWEFEEDGASTSSKSTDAKVSDKPGEDEFSHVTKFKMSDFWISDRVSIGLTGRGDEVIFEATVKDLQSPLYNTKVVLRRLTTIQAKRRGRRAIEVLKRLGRRRLMYHSYSMRVYGYVSSSTTDDGGSFTLVHGYHGSFSLRHWLQQSDWLPTLEATLALDEESARRVGDDTVGGPAVSRLLRLIRILMRDLLIGVNYLHSHGLAHTELRLENLHICPVDRHIKVGILGNAADFDESYTESNTLNGNMGRRKMMIAFDMRCVGFIMAKMVLRELMDSSVFMKFKSFLNKGNDPSCLREFLQNMINKNSSSGNVGLQILDRNWGAGWNLLSLLLATKSSERISCLNALRHPFLCGPRWRVDLSMDMIRWNLGSTAVRITEEYIYNQQQRSRLAHFIELLEMLTSHSKPRHWLELLPGRWRLLYYTGKHIGLTIRQPPARVLIGDVFLTVSNASKPKTSFFSVFSDIGFTVIVGNDWPHNKAGVGGKFQVESPFKLRSGRRLYLKDEDVTKRFPASAGNAEEAAMKFLVSKKWKNIIPVKKFPSSLPVVKLVSSDIEMGMSLDEPLSGNVQIAQNVINEVRTQIPPEMFDLSKIVCGTYIDSRLLVLRTVNGSALFFTRSCFDKSEE